MGAPMTRKWPVHYWLGYHQSISGDVTTHTTTKWGKKDEPAGCHGDTVKKQFHSTKMLRVSRWPRMKVSQPGMSNMRKLLSGKLAAGFRMFRLECLECRAALPYLRCFHRSRWYIYTVWKTKSIRPSFRYPKYHPQIGTCVPKTS